MCDYEMGITTVNIRSVDVKTKIQLVYAIIKTYTRFGKMIIKFGTQFG